MSDKVMIGGVLFDKTDDRIVLIRRGAYLKGKFYRKTSKNVVKIDYKGVEYAHKNDVVVLRDTGKNAVKWHPSVAHILVCWEQDAAPEESYVDAANVVISNPGRNPVHVHDARYYIYNGVAIEKKYFSKCTHPFCKGFVDLTTKVVETKRGTIPESLAISRLSFSRGELHREFEHEDDFLDHEAVKQGYVLVAPSTYLLFTNPEVPSAFSKEWCFMGINEAEQAIAAKLIKPVVVGENEFLVVTQGFNELSFNAVIKVLFKGAVVAKNQTDAIRKAMHNEEIDENKSLVISDNPARKTLPGGNISADFRIPALVSPTATMVGGMPYTFGLEFECSAGYLPKEEIARLFLAEIGDRSIRANEYVTSPLHGDVGVKLLMETCKTLQKHCFVDKDCGLHIHVGGALSSSKTSAPAFNRAFSVLAIRLGVQLEAEMFWTQPPSRSPKAKHTASIVKDTGAGASGNFSDISPDNWRKVLGRYVYGREFSKEFNSKRELPKWHDQRYKWLNLCHCNSTSRFKTIEFRIFSGKFDPFSVLNELRMALAFVWFVENRPKEILNRKLSLEHVISSAYRHPYVRHEVLSYVKQRTEMYKRTLY